MTGPGPTPAVLTADRSVAPNPVLVTRPLLPPLEEFIPLLRDIWARRWLTNCGHYHAELEAALCRYLRVPHVSLVANGTIALCLAMKAAGVSGEVITTPFTFVATAHAIRLVGAQPVFVDIDPRTGNMDPAAAEAAITSRTTAILPVHCFGHPCDTASLRRIADAHGLHLIYDAAHTFGVEKGERSLCGEGDSAALSFHATKVFNTFEGGAIVTHDPELKRRIDQLRNFGYDGETIIPAAGLNGKMNEVQAAFGLVQLDHVDAAIDRRSLLAARYREQLANVPNIALFDPPAGWRLNNGYFPVQVEDGHPLGRDGLWRRLETFGLYARRYFHPLICDMPGYQEADQTASLLPHARRMARQILCLPLYPDLSEDMVDLASRVVSGEA